MARKYTWTGLPARHAEDIAHTRLLEEARATLGTELPESAAIDGVMAEMAAKLPGVSLVVNVADFGAVSGSDARTAFLDADAAAIAGGAAVYVPPGSFSFSLDTTMVAPVVAAYGAGMNPAVTKTLNFTGGFSGPDQGQVFGGSGTVLINKSKTQLLRASWFGGADIGAKINAAASSVGSQKGPVTIDVGAGGAFSTKIDLANSRCTRLTSFVGSLNSVTDWGPNLIWTGAAGSGTALDAKGSVGFELDHVNISYNHAAYNGNLISLIPGTQNCSAAHIHHCRISGTATAKLAVRLVELDTTLGVTFDNCTFDYAVDGIGCSGGSSGTVHIGENCWFDKHFTGAQVAAWGHAWKLTSFISQADDTSGVPIVTLLRLAGEVNGLIIENIFAVDGGVGGGGGTIIDLTGAACYGVKIIGGNYTSAGTGTFLRCHDTAASTAGLEMSGARVDGLATGVHLGRSHGAAIKGNKISCTMPWTGTAPTAYEISNNEYGAATTSGLTVADATDIAITKPGSSADGLGVVVISVREDNASAMFHLNGSAGTTTELLDPTGLFTNAVGGAGTINVYWDAGTASYRLQNLRGAPRTLIATSMIGV